MPFSCGNNIDVGYGKTEQFFFDTMALYLCHVELSPQSADLLLATEGNEKVCIPL